MRYDLNETMAFHFASSAPINPTLPDLIPAASPLLIPSTFQTIPNLCFNSAEDGEGLCGFDRSTVTKKLGRGLELRKMCKKGRIKFRQKFDGSEAG